MIENRKHCRAVFGLLLGVLLMACAAGAPAATAATQPSATLAPTQELPTPTAIPAGCTETQGHFEYQEIQTTLMTHPLSFRVYLPVCYDAQGEYEYPVLYFLHGQSFNDDQWDRLGADEALDRLVLAGEVVPFIIVMPKESDYMSNQWDSKYGPAIAEELTVWVDEHYHTCAERQCRAIGGLSRGAAWAMRTGLIYWETFGTIGTHSLAPFRGDFNEAPSWFKKIPEDQLPRIWIDIGVLDVNLDAANTFEVRLTKYRMPHEWHIFLGTHNEDYWQSHVEEYLRWYAEAWKDRNPSS
ncbi:MAG: esterase family protein [Pelolinea sp.]|jgi:enterochelin esterase-like enzyme|nr:esterase family protein [Pelolinea sp.]